jgi:hypothetical protein
MFKNLVTKIIILIILLILFDFFSSFVFENLQRKAMNKSPFSMVTEYTLMEVNTDIILIGASETTHGYIPKIMEDSLRMSVYNCGKDGYRFFYQTSMIHGIIERYSPKLIVWSIYPDFLSQPSKSDIERLSILKPFGNENEFIKSVLLKRDFFEKYKLVSCLYRYNSRLFPLIYKGIAKDYKFEYGGFHPLENSYNKFPSPQYTTVKDDFDSDLGISLEATLDKCSRLGIEVVFVLPPRLEIHNFSSTRQYKELKRIASIYNSKIIDKYYNSTEFISDSTYFKDVGHLNKRGAYKFSTLIASELKAFVR